MKYKESPAGVDKKDPGTLEVDPIDVESAFQANYDALPDMYKVGELIALRPDDMLEGTSFETTPNVEQAIKDFKSIEAIVAKQGLDLRNLKVLEVGSGMGLLLQEFVKAGVNAAGIDSNPRDYKVSYEERTKDVEHLPLGALRPEKTGKFGLIVAKNVFDDNRYKFQNYAEMLSQIASLLEEGGIFIKMGEGGFKDIDIPENLQRVDGGTKSFFGTEVYKKVGD